MEINCNCLWSRWRARPTVVCMALTWMMWVWFRDAYGHQTTRGLWISQQQITTLRLTSLYSCHIRARPGVNLAMPLSSARHSAVDQFFPSTASFFHLSSFWIQWEIPSVHFRRIQPVVRLCKSLCQFFSFPFCTFVLVFLFIAFRGTVFSVPISPDSEKLGPQNPNQS